MTNETFNISKTNEIALKLYQNSKRLHHFLKGCLNSMDLTVTTSDNYTDGGNNSDKNIMNDYNKYLTVFYWINFIKNYKFNKILCIGGDVVKVGSKIYKFKLYDDSLDDFTTDEFVNNILKIEKTISQTFESIEQSIAYAEDTIILNDEIEYKLDIFDGKVPLSVNQYKEDINSSVFKTSITSTINKVYNKIPKKQTICDILTPIKNFILFAENSTSQDLTETLYTTKHLYN